MAREQRQVVMLQTTMFMKQPHLVMHSSAMTTELLHQP